jgi:hypothetical protein
MEIFGEMYQWQIIKIMILIGISYISDIAEKIQRPIFTHITQDLEMLLNRNGLVLPMYIQNPDLHLLWEESNTQV